MKCIDCGINEGRGTGMRCRKCYLRYWNNTQEGIISCRKTKKKYNESLKGQIVMKRYNVSLKGRARLKKYQEKVKNLKVEGKKNEGII